MKGIYFRLYCRRSCYFIHTTGCMFLFYKKEILLLLFTQLRKSHGKSWNFDAKSPEKSEKSPGKSWNLNQFFWWEQCISILLRDSVVIK